VSGHFRDVHIDIAMPRVSQESCDFCGYELRVRGTVCEKANAAAEIVSAASNITLYYFEALYNGASVFEKTHAFVGWLDA